MSENTTETQEYAATFLNSEEFEDFRKWQAEKVNSGSKYEVQSDRVCANK